MPPSKHIQILTNSNIAHPMPNRIWTSTQYFDIDCICMRKSHADVSSRDSCLILGLSVDLHPYFVKQASNAFARLRMRRLILALAAHICNKNRNVCVHECMRVYVFGGGKCWGHFIKCLVTSPPPPWM